MIFADMRMELGEHLRRLPMGFFTEGNIGRIAEYGYLVSSGGMLCYIFHIQCQEAQ